jgi:hypothetical protein
MPNAPPAPVIIIIIAAFTRALPTQPVVESILVSNFFGRVKAIMTPIIRAMLGSPIKEIISFKNKSFDS